MSGNFDRIAPAYRWLEYGSFGPFLERCRFAQLHHAGSPRRALVLGDGDGRFLARLLAAHPALTADVVDSSRSMLRLLDRRIRRMGEAARRRIHLHQGDALQWKATEAYDLVVSHFFLDCLFPAEIEVLLDRLEPHLTPNAQWIVSEFAIPAKAAGSPQRYLTSHISSYISRRVVSLLYRSFGLITDLAVRELPDYAASMRKRGWKLAREKDFLGGLLQSQLWQLDAIRLTLPSADSPER